MNNVFKKGEVLNLTQQIEYSEGGIISKQILKNEAGNITLFSLDKGQLLSEHTAPFDAMVQVIEGEAGVIIEGKSNRLKSGESIIMPANIPHALTAKEKFKMILTMIKG